MLGDLVGHHVRDGALGSPWYQLEMLLTNPQ